MAVFIYPPLQVTVDTGSLATAAKQDAQTALLTTIDTDTGNIATNTASIDTKTPTVGQKLMAASVPVVLASDQSAVPVSGPVTDAQLRASAVPVSGPLTDTQLRASAVPVSGTVTATGPLTDTQLRATPVPISGTVTANTGLTQPLTDTQLRASAVPVSAASLPLPSGAATETTLNTLNGKVTAVDTGAVVVASSALPTGAATESTLNTLNGKVTALNTGAVVVASSALPSGAATETTLSTLNGKVTAVNTGAVVVASSALPTGAATESTLGTLSGKIPSNLTVSSTRLLVDPSGVTQPTNQAGRQIANAPFLNDYSGTNVTSASYVEMIASTSNAASEIEIFDSSGQTLYLAVGAAASESNQIIVIPGGNGRIPLKIPAGTRISLKATGTSATTGIFVLNLYQ